MTVKTLGVVSLGCSKNLVDTEMMVGILEKDGYKWEILQRKPELTHWGFHSC